MDIKKDETLSPFIRGKVKIIQKKKGYRFNLDSVLLADFFKKRKKGKIIDLGTGSGIILILISLRYRDLDFYALEIQDSLYDIAQRNFKLNQLNVHVIKGDVKNIKDLFPPHSFEYVITNPPYFKTGKKPKNPEISTAKTEEKASTRDFIKSASYLLKDNGSFFMINQASRLPELISFMKGCNIEPKRIRMVHPSIKEDATHFLVEGIKNAKEGCIIEKPYIVYENPKEKIYTQELKDILEHFRT